MGKLCSRFLQQRDLCRDFAFLDPRKFAEFKNKEIPKNALSKLCNTSGLNIDREVVKDQLTLPDEYERDALGELAEGASDDESDQDDGNGDPSFEPTRSKQDSKHISNIYLTKGKDGCDMNFCKTSFSCVFKVLYVFGLHSELYCVNTQLMTLAVTQVECERKFSL